MFSAWVLSDGEKNCEKVLKKRKLLIVGTVRNVERTLARDIVRINSALGDSWQKSFHFVESDSSE